MQDEIFTAIERDATLVTNLGPTPQSLTVCPLPETVRFSVLDETSVIAAMTEPERFCFQRGTERSTKDGSLFFALPPYAVARIDSV